MAAPRRDSGTRLTASSASDGRSSEKAAPIASAPATATATDSASMIATRPKHSTMPDADDAGHRAVAIRKPAADDACEHDGRRERGEYLGAVADVSRLEVEDQERGDRGKAHAAKRQAEAGEEAVALNQRPGLDGLG